MTSYTTTARLKIICTPNIWYTLLCTHIFNIYSIHNAILSAAKRHIICASYKWETASPFRRRSAFVYESIAPLQRTYALRSGFWVCSQASLLPTTTSTLYIAYYIVSRVPRSRIQIETTGAIQSLLGALLKRSSRAHSDATSSLLTHNILWTFRFGFGAAQQKQFIKQHPISIGFDPPNFTSKNSRDALVWVFKYCQKTDSKNLSIYHHPAKRQYCNGKIRIYRARRRPDGADIRTRYALIIMHMHMVCAICVCNLYKCVVYF